MPGKKKKYNARFPPRRIKKIMQSDEEVGKVAAPVPVIISRTLELFVDSLLTRAGAITAARQARTLTPSHLKQCIMNEPRFDFLQDLFVFVPDIGTDPDSETEPGTPLTPCGVPQYPLPESETTHRGRGRGRGRPRGRSASRGRGEVVTTPDDSSFSPGSSSLATGLLHCSLKRGRPRGRPRKTPPGLEANSRIRGDCRPSMSTSSFATDDEDDDSNEEDVLELDLECGGSSSEDDEDDDEEEDHSTLPQGSTRPGESSGGDHLSREADVPTNAPVSMATTRNPVLATKSLPSAFTLPQGIQISIPGVTSSLPTSRESSNPFFPNGVAPSRPSGGATGVPVSVITSTQEFKKGTTPSSPQGGGKPRPPRVVEVDEDYDC